MITQTHCLTMVLIFLFKLRHNSFHEMRNLGLPTLFYPNMNTGMDDQLARCKVAEDEQWGLVLLERSEKSVSSRLANYYLFSVVKNQ